ncbi:hypothetical protein [Actinomadura monticuli]|uniref:Uncharacterized protein n=1 Tax=Actinomadura monticuli TaxID=3097367 RepID=A0ABV4QNN9_9ACTN
MRSRIPGGLLPVAVAAAAFTAMAVPASAADAPPPAPRQSTSANDCVQAMSLLSSLVSAMHDRIDLTRAVCSMEAEEEPAETVETAPVESTYTEPGGRTVKQRETLLGLPVEWPKSLTIKVPTLNEGVYTYQAGER